jgi:hypothetical protein
MTPTQNQKVGQLKCIMTYIIAAIVRVGSQHSAFPQGGKEAEATDRQIVRSRRGLRF